MDHSGKKMVTGARLSLLPCICREGVSHSRYSRPPLVREVELLRINRLDQWLREGEQLRPITEILNIIA